MSLKEKPKEPTSFDFVDSDEFQTIVKWDELYENSLTNDCPVKKCEVATLDCSRLLNNPNLRASGTSIEAKLNVKSAGGQPQLSFCVKCRNSVM